MVEDIYFNSNLVYSLPLDMSTGLLITIRPEDAIGSNTAAPPELAVIPKLTPNHFHASTTSICLLQRVVESEPQVPAARCLPHEAPMGLAHNTTFHALSTNEIGFHFLLYEGGYSRKGSTMHLSD